MRAPNRGNCAILLIFLAPIIALAIVLSHVSTIHKATLAHRASISGIVKETKMVEEEREHKIPQRNGKPPKVKKYKVTFYKVTFDDGRAIKFTTVATSTVSPGKKYIFVYDGYNRIVEVQELK